MKRSDIGLVMAGHGIGYDFSSPPIGAWTSVCVEFRNENHPTKWDETEFDVQFNTWDQFYNEIEELFEVFCKECNAEYEVLSVYISKVAISKERLEMM